MHAMAKSKVKQLELHMPTHGGARDGAGCKRKGSRPCVPHSPRPSFRRAHPVQITMRFSDGLPSLRELVAWRVIVEMFRELQSGATFRIVHYSILSNHLHLIVEADGAEAFALGMRSLTIRLARRLNRVWQRRGRVLAHRFHARELCSPREVRNSLLYVLCNARKHFAKDGVRMPSDWIDPHSSGRAFDGWLGRTAPASQRDYGTSGAKTWLLTTAWRRHGLLRIDTIPGGATLDSAEVAVAS
jgi:REP element-mobilizing transposase RayT